MSTDPAAWYCYAVTRPAGKDALDGIHGLRGEPVQAVTHGELTAVVSSVPAAEFGEESLRAGLEDLAWLEEVARAHNDVVDGVARRAVTLPLRLATIYLDRPRVQAMLRERGPRISAALDRVDGRAEWGVKVYADPAATATPAAGETGTPSGRSYLRKRLAERRSRDDAWRAVTEAAEAVDRELGALAEDRRRHRAQHPELSGVPGRNVLNLAYLVPVPHGDRFLARVDELRGTAHGCRIEVTGPWVPYSFALPEEP
ncbi:GvpL/GvpF family gas vesicle protein [Amycolatopsis nigrescens]|uniref:GvpL/GvpF family gas vesicle protein n=1 Tax=Amycolatopsis nigrescens TaxID=381445 RepID=UPI00036E11C2|nr:GvpL/GvpF family gas vesicle protein [Amycolatopsis nigrescens]